jgi:hypothetical protein
MYHALGNVKNGNDQKERCVAYTGTWEMWQGQGSEMCGIYRDMGNVAGTGK